MKQHRSTNRRGLALGLTAGLTAGTAAGLVFGVPGLSGAASDDATVGIVQQVDDTGASDIAPDAEPGARIRTMLQPLVDDATLTADQADAVAAHIVENRPDRDGRPGHHRRGGFAGEVVTDLLGIDAETLRAALQDGATLAEVAADNGVSEQELVDALVAAATERLDQAVADGKIDAATAEERAADLEERITARVNGERPERPDQAPADDGGN